MNESKNIGMYIGLALMIIGGMGSVGFLSFLIVQSFLGQ